jgi:hypothetical protein
VFRPHTILVALSIAGAATMGERSLGAAAAWPARCQPDRIAVEAYDAEVRLLQDSRAEEEKRLGALRRLLDSGDSLARKALAAFFSPSPPTAESQAFVLREVAGMAAAPAWIGPYLTRLADAAPTERVPAVLAALGPVRTREVARALIMKLGGGAGGPGDPGVQEAAARALVRLSGRTDLGSDAEAWRKWFGALEWVSEAEWRRVVGDGLAARAAALEAQRDDAVRRLVESERRRFLASEVGERAAVLAALLGDPLPDLKRLGIELANRELVNGRVPGAPVVEAAMALLDDPAPELRRAAAELVDRLAPDRASEVVLNALAAETDAAIAASLLRSARRWPSARLRDAALHWMKSASPEARRAAIDAAAAVLDAGLLTEAADRRQVLTVVRGAKPGSLSASGLRLLCELGDEADRGRVAVLLTAGEPEARLAAARAAARRSDMLGALLAAAGADASLFSAAAEGVAQLNPTVAGYLSLQSLPAPTAEAKEQALVGLAGRLSPGELLTIAQRTPKPGLRERLLDRFATTPAQSPFELDGSGERRNSLAIAGLILLARTRLELHKPQAALAALATVESIGGEVDIELLISLRIAALLALNRIEEAESFGGEPAAWLDGLESCVGLPHAPQIAARIAELFGARLSEAEAARLEALKARAQGHTAEPDSAPPSTDDQPPP